MDIVKCSKILFRSYVYLFVIFNYFKLLFFMSFYGVDYLFLKCIFFMMYLVFDLFYEVV